MKRYFLILVGTPLVIIAVLIAAEQLAISDSRLQITAVDWPSDGSRLPHNQGGPTIPTLPADLSISKHSFPDPVIVGETLTYTITITNEGPAAATGVILRDLLPLSVEFGSAVPSRGSCNHTPFVVTCDLNTLTSFDTAVVSIVVTPTQLTIIANTANVSSADVDDPNLDNNTTIERTLVTKTIIYLPIIFKNYP